MMPTVAPFIGECVECGSIKEFATARQRDLWEKHHPHDCEGGDV